MERRIVNPLAAALVLAAACAPPFTEPKTLGGKLVSAEVLNAGRESYMRNCFACHGEKGDGKGPASIGVRPPPRDLTLGVFKFAGVAAGELPNDADLLRIVKGGLHGTAMLPWDVPQRELEAIIQYIKTFSPRWSEPDAQPGAPVVASDDPYKTDADEKRAIERGSKLYHVTARCAVCHPHYLTRAELSAVNKELTDAVLTEFRPDMYGAVLKKSEELGVAILPPDFLNSELRAGTTEADLYRTIASGVGGTAMPSWKGALPEEDLWAIVHYVKSLVDLRSSPAARELRQRLDAQPPYTAPAPAP